MAGSSSALSGSSFFWKALILPHAVAKYDCGQLIWGMAPVMFPLVVPAKSLRPVPIFR